MPSPPPLLSGADSTQPARDMSRAGVFLRAQNIAKICKKLSKSANKLRKFEGGFLGIFDFQYLIFLFFQFEI